jgi:hypothetical protein
VAAGEGRAGVLARAEGKPTGGSHEEGLTEAWLATVMAVGVGERR